MADIDTATGLTTCCGSDEVKGWERIEGEYHVLLCRGCGAKIHRSEREGISPAYAAWLRSLDWWQALHRTPTPSDSVLN